MPKPSLMDGLMASDEKPTEEESGLDSGAAFEELRKRFLNGDPEQAQDAFKGLMACCDEMGEGEYPGAEPGKKPGLHILIGAGK